MAVSTSLDPALGRLAVGLTRGYQRFLSPYKGFTCAHRARHGGPSCSEYAVSVFTAEGLCAGLRRLASRFRACHAASRDLKEAGARAWMRTHDEDFDLPIDLRETPSPPKDRTGADWASQYVGSCVGECAVEGCGSALAEACGSCWSL